MTQTKGAAIKNIVIVALAGIAFVGWASHYTYKSKVEENEKATAKQVVQLAHIALENHTDINQLYEKVKTGREEDSISATEKKIKKDTTALKSTIDTASKYILLVAQLRAKQGQVNEKNDSLTLFKRKNLEQENKIKDLTETKKNLTVMVENLDALKTTDSQLENADIGIRPLKKKGRGIFSPQKNYFRITRADTSLKVNGEKYYDYAQTNDEINQFNIQLRGSYNFSTRNFSVGPGFEFKINRLGINAGWLFNPETFKGGLSLGTRFDIHRTRFK